MAVRGSQGLLRVIGHSMDGSGVVSIGPGWWVVSFGTDGEFVSICRLSIELLH